VVEVFLLYQHFVIGIVTIALSIGGLVVGQRNYSIQLKTVSKYRYKRHSLSTSRDPRFRKDRDIRVVLDWLDFLI